MGENKKALTEELADKSLEEVADFFDSHDMGDYDDEMPEVAFEVSSPLTVTYYTSEDEMKSAEQNEAEKHFVRGLQLLNENGSSEAEIEFRQAIAVKPEYIRILLNTILKSLDPFEDCQEAITAIHFVLKLDPTYKIAKQNLATAYLNYAVNKAREGDLDNAEILFKMAFDIDSTPEITNLIRENLSAVYTERGSEAYKKGDFNQSLSFMIQAYEFQASEQSRDNLGLAYAYLALHLLSENDFFGAARNFESAEAIGLVVPEFISGRGVALARANRLEAALLAFQKALNLQPDNEAIKANLLTAKKAYGAISGEYVKDEIGMSNFTIEEVKRAFHNFQPQAYNLGFRLNL